MINHLLIQQRLVLIAGFLKELEKLALIQKEEFLMDKIKSAAVESYLRRSLEAIFDIGRHILSKIGAMDLATEYKAIARGLIQKNVVDNELGQKLVKMAGYRNRLVHLYNEINDEELYSIIATDLGDIKNFVSQIQNYLSTLDTI